MRKATSGTSANVSAKARGALLLSAALVASAPEAARADDVEACATASEKGQELRDQGRLGAARALFVECAADKCPAVVRKDCAAWLSQVDDKLPTVAIHARDAEGRDIADVRVSIDGEVIAERLDGRAIAVDPGTRMFRFFRKGAPEVTQSLLLREGEKARPIDVVLGDGTAPPKNPAGATEPPAWSVPPSGWAFGGVSIAAFGAAIGFGLAAKSAVDDMRAPGGCAPFCDPARVDAARRDMIVANVMIGVGSAALLTAVIVTIVEARSRSVAPPRAALHLGGGSLFVSAAF